MKEAALKAADGADERPEEWHAQPVAETLRRLGAPIEGLSEADADERLARYGPNRLRPPKRQGPLVRFLLQFHNLLIYVLLGAAVVTAGLGHWVDTGVIIGVVVINALVGFIQEGKAESALEAIRSMLSLQATVQRDGHRVVVPAERLVPGDVVFLQSGDKVPADARLIRQKGLRVQEAALTGESLPTEKGTEPVAPDTTVGDRTPMVFSGTLVASGQATAVVVATGDTTEIGRIGTLLAEVQTLTTPLLRQMAQFARVLTGAILVLAAITFAFGLLFRGFTATEMFLAGVGLAVAAIPEGLPAIMTITLAIGVQRMARRNAIIRRLPAVETLGSVTVACSDKTGTLTRNEMTVQTVATAHHVFEISGVGYAPLGDFLLNETEIRAADHPLLMQMMRAAVLCNEADVRSEGDDWIMEGDPTEGALVTVAMKAGMDPEFERKANPRTDIIPFESEHRFMATLHHDHEGRGFVYVKGAPERILAMCSTQRTREGDTPIDADDWHQKVDRIAAHGQRVLAVAVLETNAEHRDLRFEDVDDGLTLLGLFGQIDPPRPEAVDAVGRCQSAGIRVKMITGDHAATAQAIGRELALAGTDTVLTGREIDTLDEAALQSAVADVDVFARTSPEHKLRLVEALQAGGDVVAMTGDGVNDAPALKRADVGVAMGVKGTEAAKEAAEMVLADDNFASIAHAVEEGRTVYDNLKKAIVFILPTNGGEALTIIAAILLGTALPITPVQILWVNMITAVTLALAIAFEPAEADVMDRRPRAPDEPLLSGFLVWRITFVSVILVAGIFFLFVFEQNLGSSEALARTVAVNTLVMFEAFYLLNTRFLLAPVCNRRGLLGSRPVLLAIVLVMGFQLAFTYAPPFQVLFGTEALSGDSWMRIVAVATSVFVLVELEKFVIRSLARRRAASG